jgi:hypothetical protein
MQTYWKRFFWGAPSHKSIAWAGALSGLGLIAFALFMLAIGHGMPLFMVAIGFLGVANAGWGAELLPANSANAAGWMRVGRWGSALIGSALAALSLLLGLTFGPVYGVVILGMGLLQIFEFAPGGPANRP